MWAGSHIYGEQVKVTSDQAFFFSEGESVWQQVFSAHCIGERRACIPCIPTSLVTSLRSKGIRKSEVLRNLVGQSLIVVLLRCF